MKRIITLTELDRELYEELREWGVFLICPITPDDIGVNTYQCGILRMENGMYAGCTIFRICGDRAVFLYIELIQSLRGKGLGKLMFNQSLSQLKDNGITKIDAPDPLDTGKTVCLSYLGFTISGRAVYMEYSEESLKSSLLHKKLHTLTPLMKNVVSGPSVSTGLKSRFYGRLTKNGLQTWEQVLYSEDSLFYIDAPNSITGYLGISASDDSHMQIADLDVLAKKDSGVAIRLALLGSMLTSLEKGQKLASDFKLELITDNPEVEKELTLSFGQPGFFKELNMYVKEI